jgi:hypothetical protein
MNYNYFNFLLPIRGRTIAATKKYFLREKYILPSIEQILLFHAHPNFTLVSVLHCRLYSRLSRPAQVLTSLYSTFYSSPLTASADCQKSLNILRYQVARSPIQEHAMPTCNNCRSLVDFCLVLPKLYSTICSTIVSVVKLSTDSMSS